MTLTASAFLITKVTLILVAALVALKIQLRVSAAVRHLVCLAALAIVILLAPTVFETAGTILWRITVTPMDGARQTGEPQVVSLWPAIRILWGAGVLLLLIRLAVGYWFVARMVRRGKEIASTDGIPIRRCEVSVPLAAGLLRPVIVLPAASEKWTEEVRQAAIRHEYAHIERADRWANLLANVACALFWFHPLVWLVRNNMHAEQEAACDDATIESGFTPDAYGEALLAVAKGLSSRPSFSTSMADPMTNKNTLAARISRLAAWQPARPLSISSRRRFGLTGVALLTALALLGPASAQQKEYKIGNGVSAPRILEKIEPDYTPEAHDAKISGTVQLSVLVGAEGRADEVTVVKSLDPGLDANAVAAIKQWKFAPGQFKGKPVPVRGNIEVKFRLL